MTKTKNTGMQNGLQMRITDEDRSLIKSTFRNNPRLMTLLRKMFLPELDPNVEVGQMIDLWYTLDNVNKGVSLEEQLVNLKARNLLITHVDQQLLQLKLISEQEDGPVAKVSSNK